MTPATINRRRTQEASVVARLRRLVPQRPLSFSEAQQIAERQATSLLQLTGVDDAPVSEELIIGLPRIDVQYRAGLPGSGMTTWERGAWRIGINADEPRNRQRFTLAHELKHVLDASHEAAIYGRLPAGPARQRHIEAVCDHFAACLLMPRPWVKRAWGSGLQDLADLARHFEVSQAAMLIRLQALGLVEPTPRCVPAIGRVAVDGRTRPANRLPSRWQRRASASGPVVTYQRSVPRAILPSPASALREEAQ